MINIILKDVEEKLKDHPKRLTNVMGVYETAVKIAKHYGFDVEKVAIAALLHDYMKYETLENFFNWVSSEEIIKYKDTPVIYHAIAAANYYLETYGKDPEIYEAIRYHVWGNVRMSNVAKAVFVSDYCEPSRTIPDKQYIYEVAFENLDACVLYCMQATKIDLERRKLPISSEQLECIKYYEELLMYGKN